jgi:hypothetical protein
MTSSAGKANLAKLRINLTIHHDGKQYGKRLIRAGEIFEEEDTANKKPASLKQVKILRETMVCYLERQCYSNATDAAKDTISKLILDGKTTGDTFQKYPLPGMNDFIELKVNTGNDIYDDIPNGDLVMFIEDWLDDSKATLDVEMHTRGLDGYIKPDQQSQQPPQQQQTTQQATQQQQTQQQQTTQQQTNRYATPYARSARFQGTPTNLQNAINASNTGTVGTGTSSGSTASGNTVGTGMVNNLATQPGTLPALTPTISVLRGSNVTVLDVSQLPAEIQNCGDDGLIAAAWEQYSILSGSPLDKQGFQNKQAIEAFGTQAKDLNLQFFILFYYHGLQHGVFVPPLKSYRTDESCDPTMGILWQKSLVGQGVHSRRAEMSAMIFQVLARIGKDNNRIQDAITAADGNGYTVLLILLRGFHPILRDVQITTKIPFQSASQSIASYVKMMREYRIVAEFCNHSYSEYMFYVLVMTNLHPSIADQLRIELDRYIRPHHDQRERIPFELTSSQLTETLLQACKKLRIGSSSRATENRYSPRQRTFPTATGTTQNRWNRHPRGATVAQIEQAVEDGTLIAQIKDVSDRDELVAALSQTDGICKLCPQHVLPKEMQHKSWDCPFTIQAVLGSKFGKDNPEEAQKIIDMNTQYRTNKYKYQAQKMQRPTRDSRTHAVQFEPEDNEQERELEGLGAIELGSEGLSEYEEYMDTAKAVAEDDRSVYSDEDGYREEYNTCHFAIIEDEGNGPKVEDGLVDDIVDDVMKVVEKESPMHRKELQSVGKKTDGELQPKLKKSLASKGGIHSTNTTEAVYSIIQENEERIATTDWDYKIEAKEIPADEQLQAPRRDETEEEFFDSREEEQFYDTSMNRELDPDRPMPKYYAGDTAECYYNGFSTQVVIHQAMRHENGSVYYEVILPGAGKKARVKEEQLDPDPMPKGQPALLNPHTTSA